MQPTLWWNTAVAEECTVTLYNPSCQEMRSSVFICNPRGDFTMQSIVCEWNLGR